MAHPPGGPRFLSTRKDVPHPPRQWGGQRLTWLQRRAAEVVGCLLGLSVCLLAHDLWEVEDEDCPPEVARAPEEVPVFLASGVPGALAELAIPPQPLPGQQTKCDKKRSEVRINGACYMELAQKPPCGEGQFRHDGKCWAAVQKRETPRTSIDE